jgi:hypothetical protein
MEWQHRLQPCLWRDYSVQHWWDWLNFLVRPGRLIGIRARRIYRYHHRQHRRVDCSCYGDHSRYAELNGVGCCSNLSLRSSGVRLLRDGAIASAIVARKLNIVIRSLTRIDGRLIQDQQGRIWKPPSGGFSFEPMRCRSLAPNSDSPRTWFRGVAYSRGAPGTG